MVVNGHPLNTLTAPQSWVRGKLESQARQSTVSLRPSHTFICEVLRQVRCTPKRAPQRTKRFFDAVDELLYGAVLAKAVDDDVTAIASQLDGYGFPPAPRHTVAKQ